MQSKTNAVSHPRWTFLSNNAHVLICIARDPGARLRDIAREVDITERTAQRIINQMRDAGVLRLEKQGRRNHYAINLDSELRHPLESGSTVGHLLQSIVDAKTLSRIRSDFRKAGSH